MVVVDSAGLPPEINSTLVHTGPGAAPMALAAEGFEAGAAGDQAVAAAVQSVIAQIEARWQGESQTQALQAAKSALTFYQNRVATHQQAAAAALQVAAEITAAISAAPHPSQVTINRACWAQACATNFMGFRTGEIVGYDGDYSRMWGQAAGARGALDTASIANAGSLLSWTPPSGGANPIIAAGLVAHAGLMAAEGAAEDVDGAAWAANSLFNDALLGKEAAGMAAAFAPPPMNSTAATAAENAQRGQRNGSKFGDTVEQTGQMGGQMGQMVGQVGSMAGQIPQVFTQAVQPILQTPQQVGQQFFSILQPLMSSAGGGHGLGAPGASSLSSGIGPYGFAMGTSNLSAGVTRPASFGGGSGFGASSGGFGSGSAVRLPATATMSAAKVAEQAAARAAMASSAAAGGGGFAPMMAPAGAQQRTEGNSSEDQYARPRELGPAASAGGAPIE